MRVLWVVTLLLWRPLRWILSFDVFIQLVRMLYHWNTPGAGSGGTFLMHFSMLVALTCFVSLYKPKGL